MTTVRLVDAVDVNGQRVPCRCGEYLIASTDDDGREVWECLECLRPPVYPNVGGFATEGAPADAGQCADCDAPIIRAHRNGRTLVLNAEPTKAGEYSLSRSHFITATGSMPYAQRIPWERRPHSMRRLYSSHLRTCAARQGVAS